MKLVVWTVLGLLGVVVLIVAGVGLNQYLTYDLPASKVSVSASWKPAICKDTHPILIGFENKSKKTVLETSVYLLARLPGRSTNYADYSSIRSDKIIKSGERWAECWSYKLRSDGAEGINPAQLEWGIDSFRVVFER